MCFSAKHTCWIHLCIYDTYSTPETDEYTMQRPVDFHFGQNLWQVMIRHFLEYDDVTTFSRIRSTVVLPNAYYY